MKRLFTIIAVTFTAILSIFAKNNEVLVPIDTVDVVCHDLKLDTDFIGLFGMAYIFANNSEYKLTGAIYADSIPPGTYTNCVMDLKHIETQKKVPAASVTITLAVDANRNCVITGHMIGEDNIYYNLHLSWTPPMATDTVHIAFDTPSSVAYYPDLYHDFMLSNKDDNYDISLDIIGVPMGETFTERNFNIAYCMIVNRQTHDTISIAAAEGRVWQSNDTTYLSANVLGFDSVMYDIDLWYAVPAVIDTQEIHIYNATFYNKLEKDGYFALVGTTADKSIEFAISLLGKTEDDIPGTYINDGVFGGFTGKNYDFINFIGGSYSTYIAKWNPEKNDYDVISIEKGNAKVTMDEDKNIMLIGSFIAQDGMQYDITLTTKVDKPRLDYDMTEGAIDCIITSNDTTLEDNTAKNGSIFFDVRTDNELLALYFYAETADPDIVIPEGTYYIDESEDYFSVNASDGSIDTYPSCYLTDDGYTFTSMYFFVSGTVEVKKKQGKLYMEINALNSYNVPAHIIYDATGATKLDNIKEKHIVETEKIMVDGQLFIIHGDKTFNTIGLRVK
ncbi:MAG: hypothetical protein J6A13_05435 [Paludibacteraceae bacterium]|nr:hypothetical protein [Paludibacteraceae bacterium]